MGIAIDSPTHRRVVLAPVNRGRLNQMSASSVNKVATKQKSLSMHRPFMVPVPRSVSFCSRLPAASPNTRAGLAATKLKLRLQLALYKLQQKQLNRRLPVFRTMVAPQSATAVPAGDSAKLGGALAARKVLSVVGTLNIANVLSRPQQNHGPQPRITLSSIAEQRKLRLFAIKASSPHFNPRQLAPLVPMRKPLSPLPPINKILKTPLKNSSRQRPSHSDTTIDEGDETQTPSHFSSLPLRDHYSLGTPNSFSVARSLLQLGLGYYN